MILRQKNHFGGAFDTRPLPKASLWRAQVGSSDKPNIVDHQNTLHSSPDLVNIPKINFDISFLYYILNYVRAPPFAGQTFLYWALYKWCTWSKEDYNV